MSAGTCSDTHGLQAIQRRDNVQLAVAFLRGGSRICGGSVGGLVICSYTTVIGKKAEQCFVLSTDGARLDEY